MMKMKEGHTEMETISPTDTGNEGIKFVFSSGQEKKKKLCGILNDVLNL